MSSVSRVFASVVRAGRIGPKCSFAVAVVAALMALPVIEAAAYFTATGSGSFNNVQAVSTAPSTVTITMQAAPAAYVYKESASAVVSALPLGGSVTLPIDVTCTAGAPC